MTTRLTELEWWALCSAHANQELAWQEDGKRGQEIAALDRAMRKVREELAPLTPNGRRRHVHATPTRAD